MPFVLLDNSEWIFGTYKLNVLTWLELLLLCMIFLPVLIFRFFFFIGCCGNNNKDEDNSLKTLNDKNHQASSQKFRQLRRIIYDDLLRILLTLGIVGKVELLFTKYHLSYAKSETLVYWVVCSVV